MTDSWLKEFINKTNLLWKTKSFDLRIYGYQIQPNTKWLSGMSEKEISDLEKMLDIDFPNDIILLLKNTKGLNMPQKNVNSQENNKELNQWHLNADHLNNYKIDPNIIKTCVTIFQSIKNEKMEFDKNIYKLVPIFDHRYILIKNGNKVETPIFSIFEDDIVLYANSLESYLELEFMKDL
jgi:hypothetical protein